MDSKDKQEDDKEGGLVGRKVKKFFEGFGFFFGEIVSYSPTRCFYKVAYEDGDKEELEFREVKELLIEEGKNSSSEVNLGKRKRGRPPGKKSGSKSAKVERKGEILHEQEHKSQDNREEVCQAEPSVRSEIAVCRTRCRSLRRDHSNEEESKASDSPTETAGKIMERDSSQPARVTRSSKRKRLDETESVEEPAKAVSAPKSNHARGPAGSRQNLKRSGKYRKSSKRFEDNESDLRSETSEDSDGETSDSDSVSVESSDGESWDGSYQQVQETVAEDLKLPPMIALAPSSGDLAVPEGFVPEVLAVYSFLRSFSRTLFLSPFTLEEFACALCSRSTNALIDFVHVSLLQALKRHLERLSKEGSKSAQICLRQPDWNLLDYITWPSHLLVFLTTYGFSKAYGKSIVHLGILDREYSIIETSTKLAMLSFLCDHVMDTEEVRAELDMRENDYASLSMKDEVKIHIDIKAPVKEMKSPGKTRSSSKESVAEKLQRIQMEELQDWNSDECLLCGMDGNLICCDGCPAAYHGRCVGVSKNSLPPGDWFCPECLVGRMDGEHSQRVQSLRGAELLGFDPYGRRFMATCGYLFVSEPCSDSKTCYKYYNKKDLPKVLEVLGRQRPFCNVILKVILEHWNLLEWKPSKDLSESLVEPKTAEFTGSSQASCSPANLSSAEFSVQQTGETLALSSSSEFLSEKPEECLEASHVESTLVPLESKPCVEQLKVQGICMVEPNMKGVNPETRLEELRGLEGTPTAYADDILRSKMLSLLSENDQRVSQKRFRRDVTGGFSNTGVPWDYLQSDQSQKSGSYVNHYILGDTAATAAANLALLGTGENPPAEGRVSKRKTTTTEQLKAFYQAPIRFYWPSAKRKSMEIPKERCGWCFCCNNPSLKRGCLLNQVAANLAAGAARVAGGIRPTKTGPGHFPSVAGYVLHIEENLHSFLLGPWENVHFRKLWRKQVEHATCVHDLKYFLLQLESNLRMIALSADWTTSAEEAPSLVSGGSLAGTLSGPLPRKGLGKKSTRRAGTLMTRSHLTGTEWSTWGVQWCKRGKIGQKVFDWQFLPMAIARQAGRQGGLKKIFGLIYNEGHEVPKRSRQCAWRARVESACNISQLAVQVRCLDAHIRWDDLFSDVDFPLVDSKCEEADMVFTEKTPIYAKDSKDGVLMYLIDSSMRLNGDTNQKYSAAESQFLKGSKPTETITEEKQVWVAEAMVPLSLLKDFEEKHRLLNQSKWPKASLQRQGTKTGKISKKDVFEMLFVRTRLSIEEGFSPRTCKVCKLEVVISMGVSCQICRGLFHEDCTKVTNLLGAHGNQRTCCRCLNVDLRSPQSQKNLVVQQMAIDCTQVQKNESAAAGSSMLMTLRKQIPESFEVQEGYTESRGISEEKSEAAVSIEQCLQHHHYPMITLPTARKRTHERPSVECVFWKRNGTDSRTFSVDKLVLPGKGNMESSVHPRCFLCREKYDSKLLYIGCEHCSLWFHGDAFGVTKNNFAEVVGFKCHKCRKKSGPSCPFDKKGVHKFRKSQHGLDNGEVIDAVDGKKLAGDWLAESTGNMASDKPNDLWCSSSQEGEAVQVAYTSQSLIAVDTPKEHVTAAPSSAMDTNLEYVNCSEPPCVEDTRENLTARSGNQIVYSYLSYGSNKDKPFVDSHSYSENLLDRWEAIERAPDACGSPDMMGSGPFPLSDEALAGTWNTETCSRATLSFTELLSSEDDWVEELADVAMDFGENWSEISCPVTFTNIYGRSQSLETNTPFSLVVEAHGQNEIITDRVSGRQGETLGPEAHLLKDSVMAADEAKRVACAICSVNGVPPDLQCIGCGVAVHQQCCEWGPCGIWTGYGWTCDGCKAVSMQGQDVPSYCTKLVDSRILLQS